MDDCDLDEPELEVEPERVTGGDRQQQVTADPAMIKKLKQRYALLRQRSLMLLRNTTTTTVNEQPREASHVESGGSTTSFVTQINEEDSHLFRTVVHEAAVAPTMELYNIIFHICSRVWFRAHEDRMHQRMTEQQHRHQRRQSEVFWTSLLESSTSSTTAAPTSFCHLVSDESCAKVETVEVSEGDAWNSDDELEALVAIKAHQRRSFNSRNVEAPATER